MTNINSATIKSIPESITGLLSTLMTLGNRLENWRIYLHLFRVELKLRLANTDHLSAELKQQRFLNLDRLSIYRRQGVFPKNLDFPKNFIPYFKDAYGTPCAVAYLMEQSGEHKAVTSIVNSCNHVYVNSIKEGPVLDWIKQSGLTQKEAALIQPMYGYHYIHYMIVAIIYSLIPLAINFVLSGVLITIVVLRFYRSRLAELKHSLSRERFWSIMGSFTLMLIGFLVWYNTIILFSLVYLDFDGFMTPKFLISMCAIVPLACLVTFVGLMKFLFFLLKKTSSTVTLVLYSIIGTVLFLPILVLVAFIMEAFYDYM
ncbi:MAG: hypothetical protein J4F36_13965 [Nitrosopumilaceae archaeon]|nr:hypothetical protein [Nitrosopumilaceae archaeon]